MTSPRSSRPASSKSSPEKGTYKNVYGAAISPLGDGVKVGKGETIQLTEKEAEACSKMLKRV